MWWQKTLNCWEKCLSECLSFRSIFSRYKFQDDRNFQNDHNDASPISLKLQDSGRRWRYRLEPVSNAILRIFVPPPHTFMGNFLVIFQIVLDGSHLTQYLWRNTKWFGSRSYSGSDACKWEREKERERGKNFALLLRLLSATQWQWLHKILKRSKNCS